MLNVVIEGCGHGQLDDIYASCKALEAHAGKPIDLLICCGDFQVREDAGSSRFPRARASRASHAPLAPLLYPR